MVFPLFGCCQQTAGEGSLRVFPQFTAAQGGRPQRDTAGCSCPVSRGTNSIWERGQGLVYCSPRRGWRGQRAVPVCEDLRRPPPAPRERRPLTVQFQPRAPLAPAPPSSHFPLLRRRPGTAARALVAAATDTPRPRPAGKQGGGEEECGCTSLPSPPPPPSPQPIGAEKSPRAANAPTGAPLLK